MDFQLSDDQCALQDVARELLGAHASSARVRAVVDADVPWDSELWKAMVDQGWPGIAVAIAHGGVGLGWVEAALLLEEVGAHAAPAPVLSQLVALDFLAETRWGPSLLAGETTACVAWSGEREVVPYAPAADVAVVVRDGDLVAAALAGGRPDRETAMDVTRPVGWLDPESLQGDRLGGESTVGRFLDVGAVAYSAELLGAAQRMLNVTVQYAKDRVQFGQPIGAFQAVKHRCADMLVDVEGMRSAVWWAAWCLQTDHPDRSLAASTAKTWCSDSAPRVMASALQVHGGIGFTWDHDLHLYLKRTHLDRICFGDADWHRARLARLLHERVAGEGDVL